MAHRDTVVGVFNDTQDAQRAVQELRREGFREDQIGVVSGHHGDTAGTAKEGEGNYAAEGGLAGLATGAGIGALWGLGILAGMVPAIGPAIAGGVLGTVLSSAAAGAAAAGIAGALIGLGIPEEEAEYYENEFKAGRTIVTVKADGRHDEVVLDPATAQRLLPRHGTNGRNRLHRDTSHRYDDSYGRPDGRANGLCLVYTQGRDGGH